MASHDKNPRLASKLEERKRQGMTRGVDEAYRLALGTLLTLSSRPILYQGDELMQCGWKWNGNPRNARREPGDGSGIYDETLREPFPWYRSGKGQGANLLVPAALWQTQRRCLRRGSGQGGGNAHISPAA